MKIMRNYEEIFMKLKYLDKKRADFIENGETSCALALASQIELLKWVLMLNKGVTEE